MLTQKEYAMLKTMLEVMQSPASFGEDRCLYQKDIEEILKHFTEAPRTGTIG